MKNSYLNFDHFTEEAKKNNLKPIRIRMGFILQIEVFI